MSLRLCVFLHLAQTYCPLATLAATNAACLSGDLSHKRRKCDLILLGLGTDILPFEFALLLSQPSNSSGRVVLYAGKATDKSN